MDLHPQQRRVDPTRQQAGRQRCGWARDLSRLLPSLFLPTATPRSSADLATTTAPARHGSSPAATGSGPNRATSWSAPVRWASRPCAGSSVALSADGNTAIIGGPLDPARRGSSRAATASGPSRAASSSAAIVVDFPGKASPSPFPPTVTPPSLVDLGQPVLSARPGSSRAATGCGPSRATSWSAPARLGGRSRPIRRPFRRRQHRHYRRAFATTLLSVQHGYSAQQRGVDPAGQQAGRHRRGRAFPPSQGTSVALVRRRRSTAIVGGPIDNLQTAPPGSSPRRSRSSPTPTTSTATA